MKKKKIVSNFKSLKANDRQMFFLWRFLSLFDSFKRKIKIKMKNEWGKIENIYFSSSRMDEKENENLISLSHSHMRLKSINFIWVQQNITFTLSELSELSEGWWGRQQRGKKFFFFVAISEHENIINNTQKANKKINQKRALNGMMSVAWILYMLKIFLSTDQIKFTQTYYMKEAGKFIFWTIENFLYKFSHKFVEISIFLKQHLIRSMKLWRMNFMTFEEV